MTLKRKPREPGLTWTVPNTKENPMFLVLSACIVSGWILSRPIVRVLGVA